MGFARRAVRNGAKGAVICGVICASLGAFGVFLGQAKGVTPVEGWELRLLWMGLWGALWGATIGLGCTRPILRNTAVSLLLTGVPVAASMGSILLVTFLQMSDNIGGGVFLALMVAGLTAVLCGSSQFSKEKDEVEPGRSTDHDTHTRAGQ